MRPILAFGEKTFESLKIRNYRLYFIGQAVSMSGTWMQTVALGWFVLQLTGSGSQLGIVTALQFLPMLFLGPWGGVITDRFDKRVLLIWTQIAFALFAGLLGVLIFFDAAQLWIVYIIALAFGFIRIFDNPARQTFVSEMVPPDHLKNAVSLNATINNLARAVGPSIGGILIASVGVAACFIFNALSYVVVIMMLRMMQERDLERSTPSGKAKGQLMEGLRYINTMPRIRNVLIIMGVIGTFAYEFQVSLPILAEHTFNAGVGGYAALMASFGAGAVAGGLFAASRRRISMRHFVVSLFFFGVSILLTAIAPTLALAIAGMAIVGFFSINLTSLGNTMLQLEADPRMRGRVMAIWSVAMIGSTPIGGPLVGWIGDSIGARWALALGGISALLMVVFAILVARRAERLQHIPEDVQVEDHRARIGIHKLE